jgi:hypothetical protein
MNIHGTTDNPMSKFITLYNPNPENPLTPIRLAISLVNSRRLVILTNRGSDNLAFAIVSGQEGVAENAHRFAARLTGGWSEGETSPYL